MTFSILFGMIRHNVKIVLRRTFSSFWLILDLFLPLEKILILPLFSPKWISLSTSKTPAWCFYEAISLPSEHRKVYVPWSATNDGLRDLQTHPSSKTHRIAYFRGEAKAACWKDTSCRLENLLWMKESLYSCFYPIQHSC